MRSSKKLPRNQDGKPSTSIYRHQGSSMRLFFAASPAEDDLEVLFG
jgi:hypothetical protein